MFLWKCDCKKRKCSYENGLTTEEVNLKQVNFTVFSVKGIVLATVIFIFLVCKK
jgi:hypothetical protein